MALGPEELDRIRDEYTIIAVEVEGKMEVIGRSPVKPVYADGFVVNGWDVLRGMLGAEEYHPMKGYEVEQRQQVPQESTFHTFGHGSFTVEDTEPYRCIACGMLYRLRSADVPEKVCWKDGSPVIAEAMWQRRVPRR